MFGKLPIPGIRAIIQPLVGTSTILHPPSAGRLRYYTLCYSRIMEEENVEKAFKA